MYVSPALHLDVATYMAQEFGIADVCPLPKLPGELSEIEGRIVRVLQKNIRFTKKLILAGFEPTTFCV